MGKLGSPGRITLAGLLALGLGGCSGDRSRQAADETPAGGTMERQQVETAIDPVSGGVVPLEGAPTAVFLDEVYYFASPGNLDRFRNDPETFAVTTCPVTGERIAIRDARHRTTHAGRTWYFATEESMLRFEETPEEYATYRCPGCGMVQLRSRPTVHSERIDGREMRFCCTHCRDAFLAEKDEYLRTIVPEGGTAGSP